jgi:hypothetical protein
VLLRLAVCGLSRPCYLSNGCGHGQSKGGGGPTVVCVGACTMDNQKVVAVLRWSVSVRAFLGLIGYYRCFIQDYETIVAPLTKLLCKEGFRWTTEDEATFRALQQALTLVPVLQLLAFDRDFIVECDASGHGFGAVPHQGIGPVAFFSREIAP